MSRLNPFKREIKYKSSKKKTYLKKSFIKVSASLPNCWIAYCEYGKVCITNDEKMLRITVSKKKGKQEQHLTCKFDKHNNFRVYYSNKKGVVDVVYKYSWQRTSFIDEMLNSISNLKRNEKAREVVSNEYQKRFYEVFVSKDESCHSETKDKIEKFVGFEDLIWKLIYPMNKEHLGLKSRPPICFHRSIRSHDPKEFTRKFFGKAPKSLVKAVIEHLPIDEHSINSLFLARSFYGIWPLDKVVNFLYLAKQRTQTPFVCSNRQFAGQQPDTEDYRKINIWTNFFRKFTSRKILNWYQKYPKEFGIYVRDTIKQLEEIKKQNIKVRLSKKMDIKKIHDVVSKIYRQIQKSEFALPVYDGLYEINNKKVVDYDLVFPRTNYDLIDWGTELNNCVGSYGKEVASGRSVIFSLQKERKPLYCVEFFMSSKSKSIKMIQCKGKHNSNAPEEIRKGCENIVESAFNSDIIKGNMKLVFPEEHKVKDITKNIDLDALERIENISHAIV